MVVCPIFWETVLAGITGIPVLMIATENVFYLPNVLETSLVILSLCEIEKQTAVRKHRSRKIEYFDLLMLKDCSITFCYFKFI